MKCDLILRGAATIEYPQCDIAIRGETIVAMGERLDCSGPEYDASGKLVLPGLIDHHIHLLATAAKIDSIDLAGLTSEAEIIAALRAGSANLAPHRMVRAIGFDERALELPDRGDLDRWLPQRPLKVQDRTGALWLLNGLAIGCLGDGPFPDCVESDRSGNPTGRIWRGDAWLRTRFETDPPPVVELGRQLTAFGITGVTDTSPSNGPDEAALFEELIASGELPQHLQLMGNETLPVSSNFHRGPLKLHCDERDLPPLSDVASRIRVAREQKRNVAAHCVTEAELSFFIAALDEAGGAQPGDRVEHGSVVSAPMIDEIAARSLTVVTQPAFIHDRGDRYIEQLDGDDLDSLYRLKSLLAAGIPLAAGSDGPYGSVDPWLALKAAKDRKTASGKIVNPAEGLQIETALSLYLLPFDMKHTVCRKVESGALADFCIVDGAFRDVVEEPDGERVTATLVAGRFAYNRG